MVTDKLIFLERGLTYRMAEIDRLVKECEDIEMLIIETIKGE